MIEPIPLAEMARRCSEESANAPFYCRVNRSAGWAICVIVDDVLFFTSPNLPMSEAERLVRDMRSPEKRESLARGSKP